MLHTFIPFFTAGFIGLVVLVLVSDFRLAFFPSTGLFTGSFLKVPELTVCKGKIFTVLPYGNGSGEPVEVDGEVIGKSPVRLEVLEDQISILVP